MEEKKAEKSDSNPHDASKEITTKLKLKHMVILNKKITSRLPMNII